MHGIHALTIEPGGTAVTLRSETPRTVEFFAKRGSVVTPEMERLATSLLDAAVACMEAAASSSDEGAIQSRLEAMEARMIASMAQTADRAGERAERAISEQNREIRAQLDSVERGVGAIESGVQAQMMRLIQAVDAVVRASLDRLDVDAMSRTIGDAVRGWLSAELEAGRALDQASQTALKEEVLGIVRGPMRRHDEQLEDLKDRIAVLPELLGSRAGEAASELRKKIEASAESQSRYAEETREGLRECVSRAAASAVEVARIWEDARERSAEQRAQAALIPATVRAAMAEAILEVERQQAQVRATLDQAVRHLESLENSAGAIGVLQKVADATASKLDAMAQQATVAETKRLFQHTGKGHEGEQRLFDMLCDRLPSREGYEVDRCSGVAQQCDIRIRRLDHPDVRIESKAIGRGTGEKCRQRDVEKFQRDLLNLNAHGIFVSLHSGICGKSDGLEVERLANNRLAVYLSHNEYNVDLVYDMLQVIYTWDRCHRGSGDDADAADDGSLRVSAEAMKRVSQYCKDFARKVSAAKSHMKESIAIMSELTLDTIEQLLLGSCGLPGLPVQPPGLTTVAQQQHQHQHQHQHACSCGKTCATAAGLVSHRKRCKHHQTTNAVVV